LRLKILKKLRTASLNSELTGSYKKSVMGKNSWLSDTGSFSIFVNLNFFCDFEPTSAKPEQV